MRPYICQQHQENNTCNVCLVPCVLEIVFRLESHSLNAFRLSSVSSGISSGISRGPSSPNSPSCILSVSDNRRALKKDLDEGMGIAEVIRTFGSAGAIQIFIKISKLNRPLYD